jgi:hypothetical protein
MGEIMHLNRIELCGLVVVLLGAMSLSHSAEAACLSKPATDRNGNSVKQHVIAPTSEVARYQAFGFVLAQCDVPLAQLRKSVENVCRMAASAPIQFQADVSRSKGASLTQLCASGQAGLAEMEKSGTP